MVDIHSHVLFGLDDGSPCFEASVSMLQMAAQCGTTDLVASPHANFKFQFQPLEITRQLDRLSAQPGIPRLHRGCDFHLSYDNIESCLKHPSSYTINGLRYLLVEFSNQAIPPALPEVFQTMMERQITPILTHPERNPLLSGNPKQIADFVRAGCLVQITAQSLTGNFGRTAEAAARHFVSQNLVHFVASDAHDLKHRPPNLGSACQLIEREYGAATAEALFISNPTAVLTGANLPVQGRNVTKPRRWFKL